MHAENCCSCKLVFLSILSRNTNVKVNGHNPGCCHSKWKWKITVLNKTCFHLFNSVSWKEKNLTESIAAAAAFVNNRHLNCIWVLGVAVAISGRLRLSRVVQSFALARWLQSCDGDVVPAVAQPGNRKWRLCDSDIQLLYGVSPIHLVALDIFISIITYTDFILN